MPRLMPGRMGDRNRSRISSGVVAPVRNPSRVRSRQLSIHTAIQSVAMGLVLRGFDTMPELIGLPHRSTFRVSSNSAAPTTVKSVSQMALSHGYC